MIARALLWLIRVYQATLSRALSGTCRFHPSCSHYTAACVERFGAARGAWLGVRRIARCHPFNPGGYDPAPHPGGHDSPPAALTQDVVAATARAHES